MTYTIYKHIFPNNKIYIGITTKKNMKERWRNGRGYSHNDLMMKAIKKYGWKNIEHEILYENLEEKEAKQKEIELIARYKSNDRKYGYNISIGGEGANGCKHTPEQIEKQKRNRKTPTYTKEIRQKISETGKKVWQNKEYRLKMSEIHKNREHKKGYKLSEQAIEHIKKTRKVKYIKCIENGEIYRGTRDVSEKLNVDRRAVMRILRGEKGFKSAKGYHFEYI